jgi:hypothetical protein
VLRHDLSTIFYCTLNKHLKVNFGAKKACEHSIKKIEAHAKPTGGIIWGNNELLFLVHQFHNWQTNSDKAND